MSAKVKTLDVWLTEGNLVYKDVPFTVVIDWLQQGRLLEDDQVRPSGTEKWFLISASKALSAYLPRAEPLRANDQAEALEPVDLDFSFPKRHGAEDDDPDMIPLIDISLVLLVFFMMTTTSVATMTDIFVPNVPPGHAGLVNAQGTCWVGIDRRTTPEGAERPPVYSFGEADAPAAPENRDLTEAEVVEKLRAYLRERNQQCDMRILAHEKLPADVVMNMTAALEKLRREGFIREIHAEVIEKRPS